MKYRRHRVSPPTLPPPTMTSADTSELPAATLFIFIYAAAAATLMPFHAASSRAEFHCFASFTPFQLSHAELRSPFFAAISSSRRWLSHCRAAASEAAISPRICGHAFESGRPAGFFLSSSLSHSEFHFLSKYICFRALSFSSLAKISDFHFLLGPHLYFIAASRLIIFLR